MHLVFHNIFVKITLKRFILLIFKKAFQLKLNYTFFFKKSNIYFAPTWGVLK